MYKKCLFVFLFAALFTPAIAQDTEAPTTRFIFFLHNRFVELNDLGAVHPEYGKAEYTEILDKFRQAGFTVISEKRPRKTDVKKYATGVVLQIDSLLKTGVLPGNITVVGTSMGGYIAQFVATYLKNPDVNFVFIGCYMESDLKELPEIQFCGHILTIYEKSDSLGVSAVRRRETSTLGIPVFREIELHTNLKHGFLFRALDVWMQPVMQWANGDYSNRGREE